LFIYNTVVLARATFLEDTRVEQRKPPWICHNI
jgi:hypothetical protein